MEEIEYANYHQSEVNNNSKIFEEIKSDITSQKLGDNASAPPEKPPTPVGFLNIGAHHSRNNTSHLILGTTNSYMHETDMGTFRIPNAYPNQGFQAYKNS